MSQAYLVTVEGLAELASLDDIGERVSQDGQRAINATILRARAAAGRAIGTQVKFPPGYLTGANGRLVVSQYATPNKLEARLSARSRPTSLASFVRGAPPIKGGSSAAGLTVEVHPGSARFLKNAFLIRLRAGAADSGLSNLGLAIRLKPGERPRVSRTGAKLVGRGLWLLYGPSVAQALVNASGSGVAQDISPDLADYLEKEFIRLQGVKR